MNIKFIKLSGRPRKNIVMSDSQMAAAYALGMVKAGGYLAVLNAEKAINTLLDNKIRMPSWVMRKLVEMKHGTAK